MIKINETGYIYVDNNKISRFKDECFEYNGEKYIYNRIFPGCKVNLINNSKIIATAASSLLPFSFSSTLFYNNLKYKLKKRIFSRRYIIYNTNKMVVGKIEPDGLMSLTPLTSISNEIPIEIQIFLSIYIQKDWRNAGGSA